MANSINPKTEARAPLAALWSIFLAIVLTAGTGGVWASAVQKDISGLLNTTTELKTSVDGLRRDMASMDRSQAIITTMFDNRASSVDQRLERIEKRQEQLEERLAAIEARIQK